MGDVPPMQLRNLMAGAVVVGLIACGARTELEISPGSTSAGSGAQGGVAGSGGAGGTGGGGAPPQPCDGVEQQPCGSSVGECSPGVQTCQPDGFFGPCVGAVGPFEELCNDLDDDCDGQVDEGFGLGQACDGADSDVCADDVMTCNGCTLGDDTLEVCNGFDDNCNGVVDSDCEVGDCSPTLLVTGSTPSNPNCVDFPVMAGSTGAINYPCEGGMVTANLDNITFTGTVTAQGDVNLTGTVLFIGPDGCDWQADHSITGSIPGGTVQYFYNETLLTTPQGNCWFPCTEIGTVAIQW